MKYKANKWAIMTIQWHLKGELRQYVSSTLTLVIIHEQQAVITIGGQQNSNAKETNGQP